MLRVNNIEVRYSGVIWALSGVTLKVPEAGMVAVLGSNGAGKSTLLKAISGALLSEDGEVSHGSIEYYEIPIQNLPAHKVTELGIAHVFENRRVFEHLTAEQNLKVAGFCQERGKSLVKDLEMIYDYFPLLKRVRNRISGLCSGGEQQMLVVGRALMRHPKLILLDEPSLGLSPVAVTNLFDVVKQINSEMNTAFLIVEQNAQAVLRITNYGYILETGRVVMENSSVALSEHHDIKEFYLGLGETGKSKGYRELKYYRRRKRWVY
jgi:branched-chain amino acid transport system ATP-binding protein